MAMSMATAARITETAWCVIFPTAPKSALLPGRPKLANAVATTSVLKTRLA
jgi:hypothetical protein